MIAATVQDEWREQRELAQELAKELAGLIAFGLWDVDDEGEKVFIRVLGPPKPTTSLAEARWALGCQFRWHPVTGESWPRKGVAVQLDPEQMVRYRSLMAGGSLRLTHHPSFQPIGIQVFVDGRAIDVESVPPTPSRPSAAPAQRFEAVQARLAAAVTRAELRAPGPEAVHRGAPVHIAAEAATAKRGVIVADDIWREVHRYASAHSLAVKDVIDQALRGFLLKPTTNR